MNIQIKKHTIAFSIIFFAKETMVGTCGPIARQLFPIPFALWLEQQFSCFRRRHVHLRAAEIRNASSS
jgi:hypothetical protein